MSSDKELSADEDLVIATDGTILKASDRFKEVIGLKVLQLVPENFKKAVTEALKSGGEIIIPDKTGKLRKLTAVKKGDLVFAYGISRIAETIKRAYEGVWDFYYGLVFVDQNGRIIAANDTLCKFLGQDISSKKVSDVFGDVGEDLLKRILSGEDEIDESFVYNNREISVRIKARRIRVCGVDVFEVLIRTTDDERVRNLKQSFENLMYPVVVTRNGRVCYMNRAAREIFGSEFTPDALPLEDLCEVALSTALGERTYIVLKLPGNETIYVFFDVTLEKERAKELENKLLSFREMVENSIDAILATDELGRIVYANQAVKLYGYKPEELIGKNIGEFLGEEYREVKDKVSAGIKCHRREEVRIRDADGNYRWVEVVGSPIRDERGRLVGGVVVVRDITERKKVFEEVKRSRELYKTFFDASPDFVAVVDLEGNILFANRAFCEAAGMSEEEMVGKSIYSFLPEYEIPRARELYMRGIETKRVMRGVFRSYIGGKTYILDMSGKVIFDSYGKPVYGLIVSKDVTERVKLEEKLREREELYETLAESSIAGIFMIQDGKFVYVNRSAAEYLECSREEIIGRSPHDFFEEEARGEVDRLMKKVLDGETVSVFTKYVTRGGKKRYAELLLTPVTYKGKRSILGNFVDVTKRRIAEKERKESEKMYRTLAESSHTGIVILQNGRIVYANAKVQEMLGYSLEDIEKLKSPFDVVHPDFREIAEKRYAERESGKDVPESYEIKLVSADGKERWVKVLARRITFRGKPAVMINLADITDIKESEERLKKLNTLLSVMNSVTRVLTHEREPFRILHAVRMSLERLDARVVTFVRKDKLERVSASDDVDLEAALRLAEAESILQMKCNDEYCVVIPFREKDVFFGSAVMFRKTEFDSEEMQMLETLSRDISFVLRSLRIEEEREKALKLIVMNLEHFDEIADKLRNPLAIIKGFIEISDQMECRSVLERIKEQADRIEDILDDLRAREMLTYQMKKAFERRS